MKSSSTVFLKVVLIVMALGALALCVFVLPAGIRSDSGAYYHPIFFGMYVTAIPFLFALYQAYKLLDYIDKNIAFSEFSIRALKNIKYCALIICVLFAAGMPYIFHVADRDDAPGVAAIGFVILGASFVIAVFAAVLQRLLRSGMEIKSENDLTV